MKKIYNDIEYQPSWFRCFDEIDKVPTVTEAEIRAKAIDEFTEKLKAIYPSCDLSAWVGNAELNRKIDKLAEQLKEK